MSRARDLGSSINSPVAGKNLVYNGDMNISQRGTTATSVASDGYYVADRWLFQPSATGTWTVSKENDAPTGSGIATSLKILCTTAQSSLASGAFMQFNQHFEGQDLQKLKKGTSSAETTVLSFWVKSNVTGTYVARIYDATNTRAIHQRYTISSANTWEKKTWLIPGDTVGALNNNNLSSLRLTFWLAGGTTYNNGSPSTSWGGYDSSTTAGGQVNLAGAVNNYFQFTGVQWEIGSSPTQFSLGGGDIQGELDRCQRYYQKSYPLNVAAGTASSNIGYVAVRSDSAGEAWAPIRFPVPMRAAPAVSVFSPNSGNSGKGNTFGSNTEYTAYGEAIGEFGFSLLSISMGGSAIQVRMHYVASAEL